MPPQAISAALVTKSSPKSCRSTRAQSSTDDTTQPPAKKVATGDKEEEKESGDEDRKGKGYKYAN